MESLKHLNLAMNYIEANLEGEIDFQKVAQIACCSEYGRAEGSEIDHYIGVATNRPHSEKWEELIVPASTWAVFTSIGKFPETLQNIWGRIYAEWFAMSSYTCQVYPLENRSSFGRFSVRTHTARRLYILLNYSSS